MKTNKFIAAALVIASIVACNSTEKPITVDGVTYAVPEKSSVDSVSYLLGINFGSFLKGYNFGDNLNWNEIVKGMKDFVNSEGNQNDPNFTDQFKVDPNKMNDLFNEYLRVRNEYTSAQAKLDEAKFLEECEKKPGVQKTESGLLYVIENPGSETMPTNVQDTVYVHYKGTLPDGSVFDETPEAGQPVSFQLNRVIAGWTEGLQLIGEGGKITLYIPSVLGYGERGAQTIPGNTPLTFDVTLEKVHPYVEPAE